MQYPLEFLIGSPVASLHFIKATGYNGPAYLGTKPTAPGLLSIFTEKNIYWVMLMLKKNSCFRQETAKTSTLSISEKELVNLNRRVETISNEVSRSTNKIENNGN